MARLLAGDVGVRTFEWGKKHGRAPRGKGVWHFHRDPNVDRNDPEIIAIENEYEQAKIWATMVAASRRWHMIYLLTESKPNGSNQ